MTNPQPQRMRGKFLIGLLILGVFLLHQDFWNWTRAEPLVLGFLPVGLAYHAAYCVLAAVAMWLLVKFAWPGALDRLESGSDDSQRTRKS